MFLISAVVIIAVVGVVTFSFISQDDDYLEVDVNDAYHWSLPFDTYPGYEWRIVDQYDLEITAYEIYTTHKNGGVTTFVIKAFHEGRYDLIAELHNTIDDSITDSSELKLDFTGTYVEIEFEELQYDDMVMWGQDYTFRLPSDWSKGYSWTITDSQDMRMEGTYVDDPEIAKEGSYEEFTIHVDRPDHFTFVFEYGKILEPPIKRAVLNLSVIIVDDDEL